MMRAIAVNVGEGNVINIPEKSRVYPLPGLLVFNAQVFYYSDSLMTSVTNIFPAFPEQIKQYELT
jgi:hypothetical protein